MRGQRRSHDWPVARHQVEHTGREAHLVDGLREHEGIEWRELARLEHNGTTRGKRRRHLVHG